MKKVERDKIFIQHILENIEDINLFTKSVSKEELENNKEKLKAVVRSIEIIGEASKNISEDFKKKTAEIPWKKIIGTRDIFIHHYFGIDIDVLWDIIKRDLPGLKQQLIERL
jgi:uncharacterized protein with HEPN domain